jgi:hypothetical protein
MAMDYKAAMKLANRTERFRATVYAMNTLLLHAGIYKAEDYERLFIEHVQKEVRKCQRSRKKLKKS